ncbi:MAG: FkbM family methyltransferase, partial [Acidobacteria bacterium]|nr:FkbM family methyltransferase [Acidobacteriota bacterium]
MQNYIERSIYLHTFEPDETALVSRYLRSGMTVVDAGANVGYYSLMASSVVGGDGHVY